MLVFWKVCESAVSIVKNFVVLVLKQVEESKCTDNSLVKDKQ